MSNALTDHLQEFFAGRRVESAVWSRGPIGQLLPGFVVRVVGPSEPSDPWIYISDGARVVASKERVEFMIVAPCGDEIHVETLTMLASAHVDPRYRAYLGKLVSLGRPWIVGSKCDHVLLSLPYTESPSFQFLRDATRTRILWLMPITSAETEFARRCGVEALEQLFERTAIDAIDPNRPSVV